MVYKVTIVTVGDTAIPAKGIKAWTEAEIPLRGAVKSER